MSAKLTVEIGEVLNNLTVIEHLGTAEDGRRYVLCICSCGNQKKFLVGTIKRKIKPTKSCGCLRSTVLKKRNTVHGDTIGKFHYLRTTWAGIKSRCYNPNSKSYCHYGSRGIVMETKWVLDYVSFRDWVLDNLGERPLEHTLDRIDNSKGYVPWNLRWADRQTQVVNSSRVYAVNQKTISGVLVATHVSLSSAKRAIGAKSLTCIHKVVDKPNRTAYGFIWERAEKLCP